MLEKERRSILAAINLNSLSPYADGKGSVKWWYMFEKTAREGSEQMYMGNGLLTDPQRVRRIR
jgi:hypothetical protein